MKKAVITWGRMNPVTAGHEKLVNKVNAVAKRERAEPRIYLSHTQNAKKDPLHYKDKIAMAKKAFGSVIKQSTSRTIIQLMQELEKDGYTEITLVAGSDRVSEFKTLLTKYNGKDYSFDKIKVSSAGQRDPDAEGAEGMSATKLRKAAVDGDEKMFMSGVPSKLSKLDTMKLFKLIRKGLLVEEINQLHEEEIEEFTDTELEDFVNEIEDWDELDEVTLVERAPLTLQQRIKKARIMKRLAPKMKRAREIRKFRMAPTERLVQRSRKLARNMLRKKLAGKRGENYAKLSSSAKIQVDTLIIKKASSIDRIAKRMLPMVRKKEIERIRSARSSKSESFEQLDAQFNTIIENNNLDRAQTKIKREKENNKNRHDRLLDRARLRDATSKMRDASRQNKGVSSNTTENLTVKAISALQFKADKHNLTFDEIEEVYSEGYANWKNTPGTTAEQWGFARVNNFIATLVKEGKDGGLWDNIHKKRARIKAGSKEKMRAPGSDGAPTKQDFKDASENYQDGKNPERKGLAKRSGVNTKDSISDLRKVAKNSTGEKRRMAHWLANMKSGKNK